MTPYERTARASAGAMLLSERRALVALRRDVRVALGELVLTAGSAFRQQIDPRARAFALAAVGVATRSVADVVARAMRVARADARRVALERIGAELRSAGFDSATVPARSDATEDAVLADMLGGSFAATWGSAMMREVVAWTNNGPTPNLKAANAAQDFRLARMAATEVARAYNDEHGEAVLELANVPMLRGRLNRRWDSMLDGGVCKVCKAMDGQVVPADAPFRLKREPGEVHPLCRCIEVLIGDDAPVLPELPVAPIVRVQPATPFRMKKQGTYGPGSGYGGGGGASGGGGSTDSF